MSPAEDATVMPVFPLRTIEWPGNKVEIKVDDPAHVRMYQELLESGKRRIVAPLSRPADADAQSESAAEKRLHSMATVLQLEDLKIDEWEKGGAAKYVATHKVVGRAEIVRLLNPSALFEKDNSGAKVSYLQAEVNVLTDPDAEIVQTATAKQLIDSLEELRKLSERLDEPRLQSELIIKQSVLMTSTWHLIDLWQRLQIASQTHRARAHVHRLLRDWIKGQQSVGRLPTPLPQHINLAALDAPASVVEAFMRVRNPEGIDLGSEFWDRLLSMLAAKDAEERWTLLLEWTQEEVNLALARASLHKLMD